MVQFHPWFNFVSLCCNLIIIHYNTQTQWEIKFKPRIKLNHNIYPGFIPFFEQKLQGFFKDSLPMLQGLHSLQKRALSLCLFYFLHNIGNIILKVFLCLLGWIKLAPKFKDFPEPTAILNDFQGLDLLF